MLTQERANLLASYLNSDIENAKQLFELSPADAAEKINTSGYDFSVEELTEFGVQLKKVIETTQEGELSENALDNVSGGLVVEGVAISCIALGFKIGSALAKNYGW